ncbi:TPA: DNA mismatch repair endonuclease MutL [Yersinia enterocolitica]|uniref:DNA mismatch repair protein MutL n=2 Tax=Yersinia enterocolitica TaxID=630 RepID=A0A0H5HBD0_YEREN|nr:DNA mismatch repair endonuclease MutL [Yersinia enterocolitica]EHB22808.1 DNA mismatch repair protein [Yersinia enterocolitica subsp. palearctica PhRBD_Ye1]EKN3312493.1 DNA mismatch repair endonuclease MutL [Yersinia enterocolitica]EKN3316506.1 DNA mismatch repair endonuclease MutL [Yersinia enterocolitica]EKN3320409.1 DNA mismatch repair endonuclease MutL [Yersinia enterocolitica]EKN3331859.1 DNA mismatch repair endonuclease MutL [Yersinia enterocolitica]
MPIQILPPQLANQIAAGEVVERPASVVKELVENSLDADASRIDIDIERGGAKLIRIRDNGCGIGKDDLALALARHATSKISSLEDLEAILSMGFRGEALASISSVSRLILTSRTAEQNEAWQAYAEGRDMAVTIKPAAHPVGSTLEVLDLFYNTPARRKFMRTEKTEFGHIDEVVRRIALARFDVAINLSHNGKLMRQYRAAPDPSQHERRLASICGPAFLQHALAISWQHGDLTIRGWVADPAASRTLSEMQYCYVNNRMMRDRLINHAIRQAYQDLLKDDQQPAYVLYLDIDPHQVDVNVHPAKHEVRFHQARLVHDFIYQAVTTVLQQTAAPLLNINEDGEEIEAPRWQPENRVAAGVNKYAQPEPAKTVPVVRTSSPERTVATERSIARERTPTYHAGEPYQKQQGELYRQLVQPAVVNKPAAVSQPSAASAPVARQISTDEPLQGDNYSFGRVLTVFPPCYALIEYKQGIALLELTVAERWLKQAQLNPPAEGLRPQPLLIPLKLTLDKNEATACQRHQKLLVTMGIELAVEHARATLRAVSLPLRQQNLQKLIPELLGYLSQHEEISPDALATWISRHLGSEHEVWNVSQAIQLLTDVERLCPQLVKSPPAGLLQPIDIKAALATLKHE